MTKFVINTYLNRLFLFISLALTSISASANTYQSTQTNHFDSQSVNSQASTDNIYVANNNSVQQLFSVIGGTLRKPFIVTMEAAKKRVTGNFNLDNANEILETVAAQTGLIWYDDGSSVYIYDASELKSTVVRLSNAPFEKLVNYLKTSGLYDTNFPLRSDGQSGSFYVSGPPVYVDLVVSSAKYIDSTYARPSQSGETIIKVIKLKNTFVNDRVFPQREGSMTIPGVATVLNQLLNNANELGGRTAAITVDGDTLDALKSAQDSQKGNYPSLPILNSSNTSTRISQQIASSGQLIKIVAYSDNNSLLVQGSARQVSFVEDLVDTIDLPKKQIQLSLWIIDVSKSEVNQLGVRWGVDTSLAGSGVRFNSSTLTPSGSFKFLADISALVANGNAQVVARPEIVAQENIPALFDNNSSFYAKLSSERSASLQKITYGTMISVLPRIAQRQKEIEMILNIQDGSTPTNPDGSLQLVDSLPVVTNTQISTEARVPIGYSLLIGGYTRNQNEHHSSGIPLLRSIPYAGRLFDYSYNTEQKMIRLFLIQPMLVESGEVWQGRSENNPTIGRRFTGKPVTVKSTVEMLRESMK